MSAVVLDTNDVPAAQSTHIQIVLSLVKKNSNKFCYFCRPKYVHGIMLLSLCITAMSILSL